MLTLLNRFDLIAMALQQRKVDRNVTWNALLVFFFLSIYSLDRENREDNREQNKDTTKDNQDPAAKKRRLDTISDCVATNVIEISDKDELEVYGSDIRTSTQLTSYVFEVFI